MPPKETRFFEDPEYPESQLSDLADLFKAAPEASRWGIKRPDYLARPECLPRIHKHLPNGRIFVSVRDPVDRAVSAFYYYIRLGFIPLMTVNDGFNRLLDGDLSARHPRSSDILDYGLYYKHIARYLRHFSRDQIKIIVYDDIKARPSDVIRECYEFIEVDPDFVPPSRDSRPNRGIYSPFRLWWIIKRIPFVYTYNADRTKILPKRQSTLERIVDLGIVGTDRLILARLVPNRRPRLAADLRGRLADFYREDVASLSLLLGRRLDWLD
jgi:hypothetical protein